MPDREARAEPTLPHQHHGARAPEGYWSLLKRGLIGTFHHVDRTYLPMYLSEFQYRWNRRKVSDAERFEVLLGQTQGRLDWYLTA